MPRFTFARGNAKKALSLPFYLLGWAASTVVRRRAGSWVFGSGSGIGEGALELFRFAQRAQPQLRPLWLARDQAELAVAKELGLPSTLKASWQGFRCTLRAQVIVVTHGLGDANRFGTRGAFVVQLWHGIPLKRIQLDSPVTFRSRIAPALSQRLLRSMYRRTTSATVKLLAAASEISAIRMRTAFGLPSYRVVVTGDPRDDVLSRGTQTERRTIATTLLESKLGALGGRRVLLYAPTWRDGDPDPGIPSAEEWSAIDDYLRDTDSVFVLRPHPHSVGDYREGPAVSERIRMLDAKAQNDITPVLPAVDLLITDYSSIAYDFSLTGRPILFLAPDVEDYTRSRGLYEPYREFSGGTEVRTWPELLDLLARVDADTGTLDQLRQHSEKLATSHHDYRDGRSAERVYGHIVSRLVQNEPNGTGSTPPSTPLFSAKRAGMTAPLPDSDIIVDAVTLISSATPALELSGTGPAPHTVSLAGSRLRLQGEITASTTGWSATIPLLAARWGGRLLAPPPGRYTLLCDGTQATTSQTLPESQLVPGMFRIELSDHAGVSAVFSAPLGDHEQGVENQARLEADYRTKDYEPIDAVFFESFYGQNASCNPLALDRALATARPELTRYWSVADASVDVPSGAIALIDGSEEWWRVRGSARLIIVNDWLRNRFRKRAHQTVLQTWHGTMLKKLALNRSGLRIRPALATLRERARWDILLSQNSYATRIFRRAYAFRGAIWEEGYPRDDVLVHGDAAAVRAKLGIPNDVKVLLYAPTWRDDRPEHIDHLDVSTFMQSLGDGYVTLIRGHSRTLKPGVDLEAGGVLDVTTYPDVSELFLVADALITDYSSVMFDFTVTGKPIYFFTPDFDRYREELRGFYFDLIEVAPGPVVRTPAELVALIGTADAVHAEYADKYEAWRRRFNPRDDGNAATRVVERILRERLLG